MLTYSIVVPVYNAEKYLDDCVKSILNQETSSEYEIILVDDGSADGSPRMCDAYAEKYPFVHVIHQVNQGVAAARNAGIGAAKGEYVLFLDGDDYWFSNLLSSLDGITVRKPDLIEFGYRKVCTDLEEVHLPPKNAAGESGKSYMDSLFENQMMFMASSCTCAFSRKFLEKENLHFPLGVRYGEDLFFRTRCMLNAGAVYGIGEALYAYRMHGESAIHTLSVEKMHDVLAVCAEVFRLCPSGVLADYYCMSTLRIADLTRKDVVQLQPLLDQNSDILDHIEGKKPLIVRTMYRILGWYGGAKVIQLLVNVKNMGKPKE